MRINQYCPCYTKSLKLTERPSIAMLTCQLELCLNHVGKMSAYNGNLDINLDRAQSPNAMMDVAIDEKRNKYMNHIFQSGLSGARHTKHFGENAGPPEQYTPCML